MKWLAAIFIFATLAWANDEPPSPFEVGNRAFQLNDHETALEHYQKQIDSNHTSAAVHFNLANAAFHDGQLGRAIFHYRRSLTLEPRHEDAAANLALARDEVHHGSPPKSGMWQRLTGFMTMNEWALAAVIPLTAWLAWLAAINLQPAWRPVAAKFRPLVGAVGFGLTAIALIAFDLQSNTHWVVVDGEATARFGPVDASPDQFKWFDGAELSVDRVHEDWVYARDATGRQGWVDTAELFHLPAWHRSLPGRMVAEFGWLHWLALVAVVLAAGFGGRSVLRRLMA